MEPAPGVNEIADQAMHDLVGQLPDHCAWARISVEAAHQGRQVELSVRIESPTIAGKRLEPSPAMLDRVTRLYADCLDCDSPWLRFTALAQPETSGDWSVETQFEYAPAASLSYEPRVISRPPMSPPLAALFEQYAGDSFDKHLCLDATLGHDAEWEFDSSAGKLRLSDGRHFDVQPIGVFCNLRATWRWAWDMPGESLAADKLLRLGQEHDTPELQQPVLTLDHAEPDCLALVACGLLDADFWFECDGPQDSIFLVGNYATPLTREREPDRLAYVVLEVIENFACDHRAMLEHFARSAGYRLGGSGDPRRLEAFSPQGKRLLAAFDKAGQLREIVLDP
ncbi:DUF6882 domain-containing protein [Lignipirellula cremea]|uniref:Uncharacterized protein n=1 Tax=Lignipirellula cremea TaxID=2528010 RepID=A0A518DMH5_9BACT|nr:DUF6882 domain-containing protein [Lignipirellula cremea]QDU93040.1 hypothetical protein Pla8534_08150 [Lignipirellula cremea]